MNPAITTRLEEARRTMLGFPLNMRRLPWAERDKANSALDYLLNNLGDPFTGGTYGVNTLEMERGIVEQMANFFTLPKDQAWGYVTARGSESNLLGLHFGGIKFPEAPIICSEAAHYSIDKAAKLMGRRLLKVPTVQGGEIGPGAFDQLLNTESRDNPGKPRPVIVCLTVGTTMSGAVDNVSEIIRILRRSAVPYYLHVDAALGGMIVPFLDDPAPFDFRLDIDSICISGHKMLGTPVPCSVFVCRKESRPPEEHVQYIGAADYTLGGSRSGLAPILLRQALNYYEHDLRETVRGCRETAERLADKLHYMRHPYYLLPHSTTVVLQRPDARVCQKYQLAVEGDSAHVICMPHVTSGLVGEFLKDLRESR